MPTANEIVAQIAEAARANQDETESINAAFARFLTFVQNNVANPTQLQAVLDAVKADTENEKTIAAAILENTPAEPA